jgi:predicted dehydrogenase
MNRINFLRAGLFTVLGSFLLAFTVPAQHISDPIRIAIVRMTHDHVGFILGDLETNKANIKLVGIYEPNHELAAKYAGAFKIDSGLFYDDLEKMLDEVKPEAVTAFGSIYEHLAVVEACAPRGIHVMVEKPLAVNLEHALKMEALVNKFHIHLLTDFETSWYPTTAKAFQLINDSSYIGSIRKVIVHDGHEGPKEIGCSKEFLEWLTNPVQNGGGAIVDFGCYGANLMTYLLKGQKPVSVTAVTRQFKPEIYPKVDDDATILVSYPGCMCIIQASWNWPFGRKDMEIYGEKGTVFALNKNEMRIRNKSQGVERCMKINAEDVAVSEDPFTYFANVIRGKISLSDYDPYSLQNNLIVVRILDAARQSAKTGRTVEF